MKTFVFFIAAFSILAQNPEVPAFPNSTQTFPVASMGLSDVTTTAISTTSSQVRVQNGGQFRIGNIITIDSEQLLVTNISGNILTILRGYNFTIAVGHNAFAKVKSDYYDKTLNLLSAEVGAIESWCASHGNCAGGTGGGGTSFIYPPAGIAVSAGTVWGTSFQPTTVVNNPGSDNSIPTEKAVQSAIAAALGPGGSTMIYPPSGIGQSNGSSWLGTSLQLVTTVGTPGIDTNIVSEKAVRSAIAAAITTGPIMVYPPTGIPQSTGSAWNTSFGFVTALGTPGVDTNLVSEKAIRTALSNAISSLGLFYQTVAVGGIARTQRNTLNFIAGSNITITPTDDTTTNRTILTLSVPSQVYPSVGIPQSTGSTWGSSLGLVTTIGATGSNSNVPTEAAVRSAINAIPPSSGGGGGTATAATQTSQLVDWLFTKVSNTQLSFGANCLPTTPCNVSIGGQVFSFMNGPYLVNLANAHSGSIWGYVSNTGILSIGVPTAMVGDITSPSVTIVNGINSQPSDTFTFERWDVSAGTFGTTGLSLAAYASYKPSPLAGVGISVAQGARDILAIDTGVVLRKFLCPNGPASTLPTGATQGDLCWDFIPSTPLKYVCANAGGCTVSGDWKSI